MKKEQVKEIVDRFCKGETSPLIAKEVGVDMNEFTEILTAFRHCENKVTKGAKGSRTKILYTYLLDEKGYAEKQIKKLFGIKHVDRYPGTDRDRVNRVNKLISCFCKGDTGYAKAEELGISLKDYKVILEAYEANTKVKNMHGAKRAAVLYIWVYHHKEFGTDEIARIFGVNRHMINRKLNEYYARKVANLVIKEKTKKADVRPCNSGVVFSNKSEFWRKND